MQNLGEQREEIIAQLEVLNKAVARQNSVRHIFMTGIIYGIGFVVGSVILATIVLGILVPFVQDIPWLADTFERGAGLMRR